MTTSTPAYTPDDGGLEDRVPFLARLERADRSALPALGRGLAFAPRMVLLHQHEPSSHVLFLVDGWTKVTASAANGYEALLALRGPGDIVAESAALTGRARSATVTALEPVRAVSVEKELRDKQAVTTGTTSAAAPSTAAWSAASSTAASAAAPSRATCASATAGPGTTPHEHAAPGRGARSRAAPGRRPAPDEARRDGEDEAEERDQPQNAWTARQDLVAHSPRTMRVGGGTFHGGVVGGVQRGGISGGTFSGDMILGDHRTEIYQLTLPGTAAPAASVEIPAREVAHLAERFAADEEVMASLTERLRRERVLVLSGGRFTGRRTAALMLLHRLGAAPVRALTGAMYKVSQAFSCFGVAFCLFGGGFALVTVSSLYGLPLLVLAVPYAPAAVGRRSELRADQHAAAPPATVVRRCRRAR